jgi:hypothetical protein
MYDRLGFIGEPLKNIDEIAAPVVCNSTDPIPALHSGAQQIFFNASRIKQQVLINIYRCIRRWFPGFRRT